MIDFKGKPTIQRWLFYSGKMSGYLTWVFFVLSLCNTCFFRHTGGWLSGILTVVFLIAGILLIILSLVYLGRSVRIGLPNEDTLLKTKGIYRYSRNPMYVGAHFITLSSMVYTMNEWVILMGFYSFIVYHLIILGEERFLEERFGGNFEDYRQKVRRYF